VSIRVAEPEGAPEPPLVAPGERGGLHHVFHERYLLKLLVKKELAARYQGSLLGLFWSYVQPAVRFVAYYVIIGLVLGMDRGMTNFPIHIFAGMVIVHYFTETFSSGTRSIVKNSKLIQKLPLPRELFPVASMLVSLYHTLPQMLILLVGVLVIGWDPTLYDLGAGLLGFVTIGVFGMALALIFSAANVFFRDFQAIVATFMIFVTWSVPMIYPYDRVERLVGGTVWEQVYLANPIANSVVLFQQLFWVPTVPPDAQYPAVMPDDLYARGLIILAVCLVFLAIAQRIFTRLEGKFAERL
jgi:ABC-2 type transport system permease protein